MNQTLSLLATWQLGHTATGSIRFQSPAASAVRVLRRLCCIVICCHRLNPFKRREEAASRRSTFPAALLFIELSVSPPSGHRCAAATPRHREQRGCDGQDARPLSKWAGLLLEFNEFPRLSRSEETWDETTKPSGLSAPFAQIKPHTLKLQVAVLSPARRASVSRN